MIDLSPQPQDRAGTAHAPPRHDDLPIEEEKSRSRWHLTHDSADAAIQRLSRWAGPAALAAALCLLGWWIIY